LPRGGLRPLPDSPSSAPFGPWQEAQLLSYTTSPRSTVAHVCNQDRNELPTLAHCAPRVVTLAQHSPGLPI
jgi:hypothetical protein